MGRPTRAPAVRQAADPAPRHAQPQVPLPRDEASPLGRGLLPLLARVRARMKAAGLALDGLRYAARDAVSGDPKMTPQAARLDVERHGADLAEQLRAAGVDLDLLTTRIRREGAMSLPDALPLGIVHASLAKRFPWPRFALLSQVPSHTGEREGAA